MHYTFHRAMPPYLQGAMSGPPQIAKPLAAQISSVKWCWLCTEPPYSLLCAVKLLEMTDTLSRCECYIKIILLYRSRKNTGEHVCTFSGRCMNFFQIILVCDWLNYGGPLPHLVFATVKQTPSRPPFHTRSTKK